LRALRSDLIDPSVALHRGGIVKRTGDGSIEFRSVADAVRYALEAQHAMIGRRRENEQLETARTHRAAR
jgi:adenylate cyclase